MAAEIKNEKGLIRISNSVIANIAGYAATKCYGVVGMAIRSGKDGIAQLLKKENLDIDIDKNHITINAKKEEDSEQDSKYYKKSEFRYGEFSRTIYFPSEIDTEKTSAKLDNGILKIKVPKKETEKEKTKKLTVE